MSFVCILISSWLSSAVSQEFPSNFKFGAASAAYQIEGGWNEDGKGESIWDRFVHQENSSIAGRSTGDVAADSYHLWRHDVHMAAALKLDYYRFSISWPRLLPTGFANQINKAGVQYYNDLIDELIQRGIEPVVTIYHWDLPVKMQDMGGWTNPLISDWFESYADIVFRLFGDRVKTWITINEPICICDFNYNLGLYAPGIKETIYAPYLCNKHVLMAHAKAYRLYERKYKDKYHGRISWANNVLWIDPLEIPRDVELAELGRQHMIGRYSHPIFSKEGGWPPIIERTMLEYSLAQGFNTSRLPSFTQKEKDFIRGTADFYGLNYYTSRLIRPARSGESGAWFLDGSPEINAMLEVPETYTMGSSDMLHIYPKGLGLMLSYLKKTYGDIDFLITENGYPGWRDLDDYARIDYIKDHLESVFMAMKRDNISVLGYTYWSLLDNFEWTAGYQTTFGLYDVDFSDPERPRTPRLSAKYYACVIRTHSINVSNGCINYVLNDSIKTALNSSNRLSTSILVFILAIQIYLINVR